MDLAELSVRRFAETVGSEAPAPGGGSVAALEASLGAALTAMVASLTQGRKKYAEYAENAALVQQKAGALQDRLLALMEEDPEHLCRQVLWACKHPDEVRSIGDKAQQELYISWETAVDRARERYETVLENWHSRGEKHRGDLIPFVSDWIGTVNRVREIGQQVFDLLR